MEIYTKLSRQLQCLFHCRIDVSTPASPHTLSASPVLISFRGHKAPEGAFSTNIYLTTSGIESQLHDGGSQAIIILEVFAFCVVCETERVRRVCVSFGWIGKANKFIISSFWSSQRDFASTKEDRDRMANDNVYCLDGIAIELNSLFYLFIYLCFSCCWFGPPHRFHLTFTWITTDLRHGCCCYRHCYTALSMVSSHEKRSSAKTKSQKRNEVEIDVEQIRKLCNKRIMPLWLLSVLCNGTK